MSTATHKERLGLLAHEKAPRPPPTFSTGNYRINVVACLVLFLPPLLVLGAFLAGVPLTLPTFLVACVTYFINGFGITVGYHRLFAHRSFAATKPVQAALLFAGAGAFQGSAKWWGRNHRIHHRYIDTDKDPYNATRGFWYTHMGWMVMKQDYDILGYVDIADLHCSKLVMAQHRLYFPIAMLSGLIMPTVAAGLVSGDWLGGYFYAGLAKMFLLHNCTFFINSLAHTNFGWAKQNYSEKHSSHDSVLCALLTLGEGYHNFHHEFAQDFRNGIRWYHFDPSKWVILMLEACGFARGLVRTPDEVIERNTNSIMHHRHTESLRKLEQRMKQMEVRVTDVWTWEDVATRVTEGQKLIVIGDYVVDVKKAVPASSRYARGASTSWYDSHPGGKKVLDMYVGKDATDAFTGGVYNHHEGALNMLPYLRVASIKRD